MRTEWCTNQYCSYSTNIHIHTQRDVPSINLLDLDLKDNVETKGFVDQQVLKDSKEKMVHTENKESGVQKVLEVQMVLLGNLVHLVCLGQKALWVQKVNKDLLALPALLDHLGVCVTTSKFIRTDMDL